MKKKILLLGGSAQQIVAIETAKKLGYYTVLCDFLSDNPGQHVADSFYLVSTTDKDAVLKVAKEEQVNGVLAYASDPAAPTAAYVAEKLGLSTNPYGAVETLCNKDKFRSFLSVNDFNTPVSGGYKTAGAVMKDIDKYNFPIIVKPVDSSGSKGVTVVRQMEELVEALEFAFSFSRCNRIVVEEFIEKKHPYLIGGDIFVNEGQVVLWGLMNCHRDGSVNSLVPVGKSYPLELEDSDIANVKTTLQTLVDKLGFKCGAMNVELVVDGGNRVYPIDIGPRNGGNMIPDLLGYIFDIDIVEWSIQCAMGRTINLHKAEGKPYYATYNLHSDKKGLFKKVIYSEEIQSHIIKKCIYKEPGDSIEFFDNAAKAVGIVFMKFDNANQMKKYYANINEHIKIVLEEN